MKEKENFSPEENSNTLQPAIEAPSDNLQSDNISSGINDTTQSPPPLPDTEQEKASGPNDFPGSNEEKEVAFDEPPVAPPASIPVVEREITSGLNDYPASSEEKRAGFAERLAEAFRDGVASTKPDYTGPAMRRTPSYRTERERVRDGEGIIGSIIKEGGSAAGAVVEKAAGAFDSFVNLVKQTPAITGKYAEAFKEGATSVRKGEGREKSYKQEAKAAHNLLLSGGGKIVELVSKSAGSAANLLSGAVKKGRFSGAGRKAAGHKKRIEELYVEIGRETANSWNGGDTATEKMTLLLEELRHNEEEIRNIERQISEAAARGAAPSKGAADADSGLTIISLEEMPAGREEYSLSVEARLKPEEVSAVPETTAAEVGFEAMHEPAVSEVAAEEQPDEEGGQEEGTEAADGEPDEDEEAEDEEVTDAVEDTEADIVPEKGDAEKKMGGRTAAKGKKGRSSLAKKGRNRR